MSFAHSQSHVRRRAHSHTQHSTTQHNPADTHTHTHTHTHSHTHTQHSTTQHNPAHTHTHTHTLTHTTQHNTTQPSTHTHTHTHARARVFKMSSWARSFIITSNVFPLIDRVLESSAYASRRMSSVVGFLCRDYLDFPFPAYVMIG